MTNNGKTYLFYMRGGHCIGAYNVKCLTMHSDNEGSFCGYKIEWVEGKKPEFFSLSLPDIVAVVCRD